MVTHGNEPIPAESVSRPPSSLRSWLALAGTFFAIQIGHMVYAVTGIEPSVGYNVLSTIVAAAALWYWLWHFVRRHGGELPFDSGFFLFVAMYIVIPVLIIRYQGWRGVATLAGIAGSFVGTYLLAVLSFYFVVLIRGG